MANKPTIYGFCPAGCKWEVPHKSDVEDIKKQILFYTDVNSSGDFYILEPLNKYRVEAKNTSGIAIRFKATVKVSSGTIYSEEEVEYLSEQSLYIVSILDYRHVGLGEVLLTLSVNGYTRLVRIPCSGLDDLSGEITNLVITMDAENVNDVKVTSSVLNPNTELDPFVIEPYRVFIRYADDNTGKNMAQTYANQKYMGTFVGKEASTNPADYTWSRFYAEVTDASDVLVGGEWYCIRSTGDRFYYDDTAPKITGYTAWVGESSSEPMYLATELVEGEHNGTMYKYQDGRPVAIGGGTFTIYCDTEGNVQDIIDAMRVDITENEREIDTFKKDVEELDKNKANKDGYYSQLHSGLADNLASPDGVINEEPYVFRPTAGTTSVADGYATIKKLKGNTIVSPIRKSVDLGTIEPFEVTSGGLVKYRRIYIDVKGAPYREKANIHIEGYTTGTMEDIDNRTSDMIIASSNTNDYQALCLYNTSFAEKTKTEVQQLLSGVILTYDSNENELVHARPLGIRTVGFNACDNNKLEYGSWTGEVGDIIVKHNNIRNFRCGEAIKVIPNQKYTMSCNDVENAKLVAYLVETDSDNRILKKTYATGSPFSNLTITLTSETKYVYLFEYDINESIDFSKGLPSGINLCFHLTHSGYRNGEYEEHWEEERNLNTETYFYAGMKSAGTAYDELTPTKAIKRIGVVDLGTLEWKSDSSLATGLFHSRINGMAKPTDSSLRNDGIICSKYQPSSTVGLNEQMADKSCLRFEGSFYIKDTAYTDATDFKNALSGVMLAYELATPIETDVEQTRDVNWDYRISDFGTEEFITSSIVPVAHETFYMANLRDEVRNLPKNYISKASFDNFTSALSSALGISISATYNETTKSYDFSIVKSVEEE